MPDPAAILLPKLLAALVGFIDMTNLMLPASALKIELFGVPNKRLERGVRLLGLVRWDTVSGIGKGVSSTPS